jgi:succinate-semialdehyde dehydrogenase / glutarate-semialdehyde dehydrogenase
MAIASVNPATEELIQEFISLSADELDQKLQLAYETFRVYRNTSFADRSRMMRRAAEILEKDKESLGRLITLEMGKTLASAIAEVAKCASGCRYYAENAERQLADEVIATDASRSFVRFLPLGPVLAVMPWNFPFWQVFRFAAPALMAGNVGLLKHSSNVPQCALAIQNVFTSAGFPEGAFQALLIVSKQVEQVLKDDRIAAATLTGSESAGRSVAAIAGGEIKRTVLELGGSDPFIVMPSADLDAAIETAVKARIVNNGQSCIAAKRFIIAGSIYDRFEEAFVTRMKNLRVGDPLHSSTDIGPLATAGIRDDLEDQVRRAVDAGGRILTGGHKLEGRGFYYAPTVLAGVPRGCDVFYEELFGPVAMLFAVEDATEAIDLANDSPFGLGSSVWSQEEAEINRFVDQIEAGQTFVNGMVASDPRLPFGGVKRSGYGRELSEYGIREFVNAKTVWRK